MFLHEEVAQLHHSVECENTSTIFEQLNKSQECHPNVKEVGSLKNTKILETVVSKKLAKMQNLLLDSLLN
jgi:hypothetical protein